MWFEEKWEESTSKSVIPYDKLKEKKKKRAYQLGKYIAEAETAFTAKPVICCAHVHILIPLEF